MLKKAQYVILTGIALLCLVVVIVNTVLFTQNRSLQAQVAGRQQFIQESVQLKTLYQEMVKALAELSAKNNDEQLKSLLNAQGFTFSLTPTPGASPAAPSSVSPKK